MYDAFISYSRLDLSAVQNLKRLLDERRLRVFLDLDSLRAGQDWPLQLGHALDRSRMMVLCWSAHAAASTWVAAEIQNSLITGKLILPWLLDGAPLPSLLQQKQGVEGTDPAAVVNEIANKRGLRRRRVAVTLVLGAVVLAPALWFSPRVFTPQNMVFRGHLVDEQGNAVAGAKIEVEGVGVGTNASGEFALVLPGPPSRRALRVTAWKPGYQRRAVETQSDVPDLGVVIEKERK